MEKVWELRGISKTVFDKIIENAMRITMWFKIAMIIPFPGCPYPLILPIKYCVMALKKYPHIRKPIQCCTKAAASAEFISYLSFLYGEFKPQTVYQKLQPYAVLTVQAILLKYLSVSITVHHGNTEI